MSFLKKLRQSASSVKTYLSKIGHFDCGMLLKLVYYSLCSIWIDEKYNEKKWNIVNQYIVKNYGKILDEKIEPSTTPTTPIIWVLWFQGYENMPKICKACYQSLLKHCGDVPVVLLTESNIKDYITIPAEIIEKIKAKKITLTSYSDIIRSTLLAKYGGLWVDSTLYFVNDIPKEWFERPFFSIKNKQDGYKYVSRNRWTSFLLGTNGTTSLFHKFSKLLQEYTIKEDAFIEYLLVDHVINVLFEREEYKTDLENLPISNEQLHWLSPRLNDRYDSEAFSKVCQDNICFKLTYKQSFKDIVDGGTTYYGVICDNINNTSLNE